MSESGVPLSQPLYGATFGQAVRRFFAKYATASGRASRSEYWWAVLAIALIQLVFTVLYFAAGGSSPAADGTVQLTPIAIVVISIWGVFSLAVIIPTIALTVRRLHDGNFSGWFYLLTLIGLSIVVFIFTLLPSNPAGARFDR